MLKEKGFDPGYAPYCDHTCLRAYASKAKIIEFCDEAIRYGAAAVCVNPVHVALVHERLKGTLVKTATVVGFPLGANKPRVKAFEAAEAIRDGADEVDMVINIGALLEGDTNLVYEDIQGVVDAAHGQAKVKVIIETGYLTDALKVLTCQLCLKAGADFVKTSTGMGPGGATVEDIRLMKSTVGDRMQVKASGGVDRRDVAYQMLMNGADRLGVSRTPQIVHDDPSIPSAAATNPPPNTAN